MNQLVAIHAAASRELELEYAREEQREIELTETEKWARDPVGWINDHVIVASFLRSDTSDRQRIRKVRMKMFPEQEATLDAWINLEHLALTGEPLFRNVVIEKSRQIGETVGLAAVLDWLLQYHRVTGLCMHLKLEKIDDGGPASTWESLFGKVRYIDQNLDRARLPTLPALVFKQKPSRISNPISGAVVHGKGQEDDPGRGDSLDFAILDEAAGILHGERVHQSLASACPSGKVYLSTPSGDDNMHARIAEAKPQGWSYLRLHWSTHPVYNIGLHVAAALDDGAVAEPGLAGCELCAGTLAGLTWSANEPRAHRYPGKLASPWYDREIIDKTEQQVAAEYDIDREGALGGRVYPEFQTERHVVADGIPYDPMLPIEFGWDFGSDTTAIVIFQDAPHELRVIGLVEMGDQHGTSALPHLTAAALRETLVNFGVPASQTTPFWTKQMQGIGDPTGEYRSGPIELNYMQEYAKQGFTIMGAPMRLTRRVDTNINAVKRLLIGMPKPMKICGVKAETLAVRFRNNTWPVDPISQKRKKGALKPEDDIQNHALRAFAYYAVTKFPPPVEFDPELHAAGTIEVDDEIRGRRSRRGVDTGLSYGMKL